jgi:hypothetical protein
LNGGRPFFALPAVSQLEAGATRAIHSGVKSSILRVPHSSPSLRMAGWNTDLLDWPGNVE